MLSYNLAEMSDSDRHLFSKKNCSVFISHKKEDEAAAITIGRYLTDVVGVNIYLDTKDCVLREAVSIENDQKIVDSIHAGLSCSTHLLCILSDKTRLSWWVPYEIGFAAKQGIEIVALKLVTIDDVPSYIKVNKTLYSIEDFFRYFCRLGVYGSLFSERKYKELCESNYEELITYIDGGKADV